MRSKNKIISISMVILLLAIIVSASIGYYLMIKAPILAMASDSNPFEALRIAGKALINDLAQTPIKRFRFEDADIKYNLSTYFPENKFELETAEQIIEWSVFYNNQPWVDDVDRFLSEANYALEDMVAHFVFIESESGNYPVMTITSYSTNKTILVEKGWINPSVTHSYTLIVTESIALKLIQYDSDYDMIIKKIIENLNNQIGFIVGKPLTSL